MNKLDYIIKQLREGRSDFKETLNELDKRDLANAERKKVFTDARVARKLIKAQKSFKDFTGKDATCVDKIKTSHDNVAYELGKLVSVVYEADTEDGKNSKYIHKFTAKHQPRLVVSNDGKQLIIVGGQYKVNSKRGIIG